MQHPRTVVFDLDDTLFLERDYVRSGFHALADQVRLRFGYSGFAEAAWAIYLAGGRGRIFDTVLARAGLPSSREVVDELVSVYRKHRPEIALYPGMESLIRLVRCHARTAIISDGPLVSQQRKLEALGIAPLFDQIVLTDRWGRAFWKPSERAFETLEVTLGCTACVYVGDNPDKDFAAPRRRGWWTIRVRWPRGEHTMVEAPDSAHEECGTVADLARLLGVGARDEVTA